MEAASAFGFDFFEWEGEGEEVSSGFEKPACSRTDGMLMNEDNDGYHIGLRDDVVD